MKQTLRRNFTDKQMAAENLLRLLKNNKNKERKGLSSKFDNEAFLFPEDESIKDMKKYKDFYDSSINEKHIPWKRISNQDKTPFYFNKLRTVLFILSALVITNCYYYIEFEKKSKFTKF